MKNKRLKICVYCGSTAELTRDHIPPKALFPQPRPADLITVPSCRTCNGNASRDDEYLKVMGTLRDDLASDPNVQRLLPSVLRGLARPQALRLARSIVSTIREVEIKTTSGLYVGKGIGYDVDLSVLDRVMARTVKGLYFHHFGRPIPAEYDVAAFSFDGLRSVEQPLRENITDTITALTSQQPHRVGDRIFLYWYQTPPGHEVVSAWLLLLYLRLPFLCIIGPKDKRASHSV
jgi:hypothetical protein